MLTDAELTRLVAEKVMGYRNPADLGGYLDAGAFWMNSDRGFNPLNDDRDACAVLDKMAEDWIVVLQRDKTGTVDGMWGCHIAEEDAAGIHVKHYDKSRRRSICLAALKAKGVDVG